jgi:hypothetical protein
MTLDRTTKGVLPGLASFAVFSFSDACVKQIKGQLTIPFGHTVDALCYCPGEFAELTATTATRRPIVRLSGTDETIRMTAVGRLPILFRLSV